MSDTKVDLVNHPSHYATGEVECIDAMTFFYGHEQMAQYCVTTAFKYIWRCQHKQNFEQDLDKANWYINMALIEINHNNEYYIDFGHPMADTDMLIKSIFSTYGPCYQAFLALALEHISRCTIKTNNATDTIIHLQYAHDYIEAAITAYNKSNE